MINPELVNAVTNSSLNTLTDFTSFFLRTGKEYLPSLIKYKKFTSAWNFGVGLTLFIFIVVFVLSMAILYSEDVFEEGEKLTAWITLLIISLVILLGVTGIYIFFNNIYYKKIMQIALSLPH